MGIQSQKPKNDNASTNNRTLIFTYGTLKRGFSNHALMQEMIKQGDAVFIGTYQTNERYPLVCGPYRVPFLLNFPGCGHRVVGELYAVNVNGGGLGRLDELEGTTRGHYRRLPVKLLEEDGGGDLVVDAEAYFAHESYAMELWMKSGKNGYRAFTEKEAVGYVKRVDRPQNISFLDQIQVFVSSSSPS